MTRPHRTHYNDPDRLPAPWIDAGIHHTRTAGRRRLWLFEREDGTWSCSVAGEGSTSGSTREEALQRGKEW
jgi:hypothetical protein